jgi:phage repressor protein C with HTH and peptisase S24 domain
MSSPDTRARRLLGVAVVHGRSMLPTLREGDRLLVLHGGRPRAGRAVVVRLPDGVVAVKRAVRRQGEGWWVESDNAAEGVDSRAVGALADDQVLARVLLRIWPRPRRV